MKQTAHESTTKSRLNYNLNQARCVSRQDAVPAGFLLPENLSLVPGDDANISLSKPFFLRTFGAHRKLDPFGIFTTGHILGNASIKNIV